MSLLDALSGNPLVPVLGLAGGLLWRNWRWIRHKPIDQNAVREQLGYEARPDAPAPRPLVTSTRTWWQRVWSPFDIDRMRRELGYGRTLEGEVIEREKRP